MQVADGELTIRSVAVISCNGFLHFGFFRTISIAWSGYA